MATRAARARCSANELAGRLASPAPADALARADSVVALLAWWQLTENDETWSEALPALDELSRLTARAPAELAAYVEAFHAVCLRRTGDSERARAVSRSLGFVTDWRILGPFDNERGKGFSVASGPEKEIDFSARMPGKAREVAWRENPAPDHPGGFVVLDEVLRPSQQVLAYLRDERRVRSRARGGRARREHRRDPGLRQRRERALARRPPAGVLRPGPRRDRAPAGLEPHRREDLRRGRARLGGRRAAVRARRPARSRCASTRRTPPTPHRSPRLPRRSPSRARASCSTCARRTIRRRRACSRSSISSRVPTIAPAHSARAAVASALAKQPDDVATLYLQALASAPDDRTTREVMEVDAWIRPLREVVRRDPRHVAALCDLARFHLDHDPLAERADALSAQALAAAPEGPARARRAHRCAERPRARRRVRRARAPAQHRGQRLDRRRRARARARGDRRRPARRRAPRARAGLRARSARHGCLPRARLEYADRGRAAEITRVTARVVDAIPASIAARAAAARALESLGELAAARALLQRAQEIAPEDTDVLLALSRLDQRGGDVAKAVERLDEILRIDPTQDKVRRQRELLVARDEHRFEEPYAWDARQVLSKVDRAWQADEPFTVLERTHVHKVNKDGTHSNYEHVLLRIQNDGGVKALDAYGLYYPEGATLSVKRVRLLHADGSSEAAPAPRGGDRSAGGGFVRVYDLPPLEVGDAVEVESYSDTSVPSVFGNYFGLRDEFYADHPTASRRCGARSSS
jgi:tetratricopeptide (TPR) repeat protein